MVYLRLITAPLQTVHVSTMAANYGPGTEIGAALLQACNSRDTSKSTVMFVLTDGEVRNT